MEMMDKQAFKDMTFKKKAEHVWYYFRIPIIAGIFIIILLIIFVKQCSARVEPDITVSVVTKSEVLSADQQSAFIKYFSGIIKDSNHDGKKVADCQFYTFDSTDPNVQMANTVKLTGNTQTSNDIIYIYDDDMFNQFFADGTNSSFVKINNILPDAQLADPYKLPVSDTALSSQSFGSGLDGLNILIRTYKTDSKDQKYVDKLNNELDVLKKIAAK